MKKFAAFVFAFALTTSLAFAKEKGKLSVDESTKIKVNGVQLTPGDYTVNWTEQGDSADVTITRGNKEITTLKAKVVEEKSKRNSFAGKLESDGTLRATELNVNNKKLVIQDSASGATGQVATAQ